jgi:Skp family chaperone for outer membrane proteins
MKSLIACALIGLLGMHAGAADIKIATVDLQRVLSDYKSAQAALNAIKIQEVSFRNEINGLRLEAQKLFKETEDLRASSADAALSTAEREKRRKEWETKLQDLNSLQLRYEDRRTQGEAQLQMTWDGARKKLLSEVVSAAREMGDKEGFHLVLNCDNQNPPAGEVIFSKGVPDLTEKVLTSLNRAAVETPGPKGPRAK